MFAEAGMQPGEIAIVVGINVRSVSTMLSHARSHIYRLLKKGGYVDG
jgi:DNA-directed RNA polymerase specialized sigma24 family protein